MIPRFRRHAVRPDGQGAADPARQWCRAVNWSHPRRLLKAQPCGPALAGDGATSDGER